MAADISGIVKSVLQVRANLKSEMAGKQEDQNISVNFMELMNQNSLPNMNVSAGAGQTALSADAKSLSGTSYDSYSSPLKSVSVKEDMNPEEMQSQAADSLETYEEEIRKILKDELGVTDEEISAVLESLGMDFLDLRNVQNLTSLVQALTGEDIGTLFSSEAFQNVMVQVSEVTEELCAELGITREELNVLCEAWDEMEVLKTPAAENEVKVQDANQVQNAAESEKAAFISTEDADLQKEDTVIVKKEDASEGEDFRKIPNEAENAEQITADGEEETDTSSGEQGFLEHSKDARPDTPGSGITFAEQTIKAPEEFAVQSEVPVPYSSQVDAYELIDQIAKNVRVTMAGAETSMEMQLNPEHLGKLYLNVTEREGVVRAQIAAQNTAVKEALETQLVELRQSLNQQGIKVDAIEVTVSTHEFEQNLEENANHEEQMRRQAEESGKQTRRNLNLNDLDGLTGLMSEEEQLAAQIMRDNGNQVDLTA